MDTGDLIVTAITVVIGLGALIGRAAKKARSPETANQQEPVLVDRRAKLEELAAKRRAQLEELARQRRAGAAPGGGLTPGNLSAAEVQQRQQAKTLYERRAEALQRMREEQAQAQVQAPRPVSQQRSTPPQAPSAQQRAQELARQRAEQMAKLRAKREQELAAQRQRARQELERQMRQAQVRRPTPPPKPKPEPVLEAAAVLEEIPSEAAPEFVHEAYAARPRGRQTTRALRGIDLRQAVILKEILDAPVSLRQPRQFPG